MACSICQGVHYCNHAPQERGQAPEEMMADLDAEVARRNIAPATPPTDAPPAHRPAHEVILEEFATLEREASCEVTTHSSAFRALRNSCETLFRVLQKIDTPITQRLAVAQRLREVHGNELLPMDDALRQYLNFLECATASTPPRLPIEFEVLVAPLVRYQALLTERKDDPHHASHATTPGDHTITWICTELFTAIARLYYSRPPEERLTLLPWLRNIDPRLVLSLDAGTWSAQHMDGYRLMKEILGDPAPLFEGR
ncbi:hypothetical protein HY632_04495 [Candidatus Uhrbacteria bacterium]|nr:hypothetical protein [Candidatus Uhrbacteria bacterium]